MSNYTERNIAYRLIGKLAATIIALATVFILGIVIAACVKETTFTVEWANMVAWFQTWAK